MTKKIFLITFFLVTVFFINSQNCSLIFAQENNLSKNQYHLLADNEATDNGNPDNRQNLPITGNVTWPSNNNEKEDIGLLVFISKLLRFATIIAGFIIVANFIVAGFIYLSSNGDVGAHTKVNDKITWSIVGLIIIISAYTIAGLIGLIFFGDVTFVLNPKLGSAIEEASYLIKMSYNIV